jgi:hypothetical protein
VFGGRGGLGFATGEFGEGLDGEADAFERAGGVEFAAEGEAEGVGGGEVGGGEVGVGEEPVASAEGYAAGGHEGFEGLRGGDGVPCCVGGEGDPEMPSGGDTGGAEVSEAGGGEGGTGGGVAGCAFGALESHDAVEGAVGDEGECGFVVG